ncbi:MAG: cytochrome b/b6 domain-containing protein [Thaumarchaeota archaeon]|nr:cytochrome b/b6 domain-containing protein [Candidatus Calditenuaceae archaeon]MCX8202967.1 cytochrome b/b6 domain-containing protein [Nitrososphaeria archaeon]MDW8042664.1 cytochrome b/b6 domain-containing protein [Nitrososphaerota archaeon]
MRGERVLRWNRTARIAHWLMVIGVTAGFVSGLPVLDGRLFKPIDDLLGGEAVREFLHYYVTTVFLGAAIPLVFVRGIAARGDEWWWPSWDEVKQAVRVALHWFGLSREYPVIGFHHPMEKLFLMSVHFGLVLLGLSGVLMVFADLGPTYKFVLLMLHDIGFLMVSVPLAGHFLLAVNPVNWQALRAIFTDGKVDLSWARHHHPGWKAANASADPRVGGSERGRERGPARRDA